MCATRAQHRSSTDSFRARAAQPARSRRAGRAHERRTLGVKMWYFGEINANTNGSDEGSVDHVESMCCAACGCDVAELWLATPIDHRGARVALVDEDDDVWCAGCFDDWYDGDGYADDGTPNRTSCCFRRQTASDGHADICDGCGEWIPQGGMVWWHCADTYCEACFEGDDDADYDTLGYCAESDDWEPMCAWCTEELTGTAYVVDSDESCYCFACWEQWYPRQREVDESGRQPSAAEAANTQRNDDNIARLRGWYPQHCAYHVYFHHVRGREQGCKFGDEHKCARGSHEAPPGLAMKARGLDLDVEF